jgi:hypothetical protein
LIEKIYLNKIIRFINFVNARAEDEGLPFGYLEIFCGNYL